MLAARCLVLHSFLTTYIGDVKLSTNVVYGRNGLRGVGDFKTEKNGNKRAGLETES